MILNLSGDQGSPLSPGRDIVIADVVSWVTGAAGTAIDCVREWSSPACVVGVEATADGPFACLLLSSPRHAEQLSLALSKGAAVIDFGAKGATAITSSNTVIPVLGPIDDWFERKNFGNG